MANKRYGLKSMYVNTVDKLPYSITERIVRNALRGENPHALATKLNIPNGIVRAVYKTYNLIIPKKTK